MARGRFQGRVRDWAVVEQFVAGKIDDTRCEDVIVCRDGLFAVIDGATDKAGLLYEWGGSSISSGRFAAEVVARSLAGGDLDAGPGQIVDILSDDLEHAIMSQYPDLTVVQRPPV